MVIHGKFLKILLAVFVFLTLYAQTAYAANLSSLSSVSHGGVVITDGQVVTRNELTDTSNFWTFTFNWPQVVANSNTLLGVFRGSFGNVEGGTAMSGVNYASTQQSFQTGINTKTKSIGIPALGELDTTSSTYTILVAERASGISSQQTADWFASDGSSGVEPINYAMLTFEYDASFNPQELDAIQDIWHGGRIITKGETVLKKEIATDNDVWQWTFNWPNKVDNQRALFVVFRGTFGGLEGGAPIQNVNYDYNLQAFGAGQNVIGKHIGIPTLKDASTTDSVYTAVIMERDPKYLSEGVAEQISWFASGGASGIPPLKYAALEFDFREFAECCSNVAFIPGIKAVELWEGGNRRWLPGLFTVDASRLAMTDFGTSVNDITVGSSIADVSLAGVKLKELYGNFFSTLDSFKSNSINEWKALPYDWRYDVYDVVDTPQQMHDGSTLNLMEEVRNLAATSDTGKVTVIAHSNGGLVGKALINALGSDAAKLVDRFIMVGTPQLGTPSAIGAMLHGASQALPIKIAPFSLTRATAREITENMPGAYGLLPLASYFSSVLDPVVTFEDTPLADTYRSAYGDTIDTSTELESFLLGTVDGRTKPLRANILTPTILNGTLLSKAIGTRNILEAWTVPSGIEVVQIAGWGLDTVEGSAYYKRCIHRPIGGPECFLDVKPLFTNEGDATVVYPSAVALDSGGQMYFLDLHAYNNARGTNWDHANILAADSVQNLIGNILTKSTSTLQFITTTKPVESSEEKRLRVSVHSPVSLGVYDGDGRFTGVLENPDPSSDIPLVVEEIPNSFYLEYGDGKYTGFDVGQEHELIMSGLGEGVFALEIEEVVGGTVDAEISYSDIPVSTSTIATLHIQDIGNKSSLEVDEDGDGTIDAAIEPDGENATPQELLESLNKKVTSLGVNKSIKRSLKKYIHDVGKALSKGKTKRIQKILNEMERYVEQRTDYNTFWGFKGAQKNKYDEGKGDYSVYNKHNTNEWDDDEDDDKHDENYEEEGRLKKSNKINSVDAQVLIDMIRAIKEAL